MKLYKYTFGDWELYGPANDDADAYERRIAVDPQFHYVPVVIEEVILEGYEIVVTEISLNKYQLRSNLDVTVMYPDIPVDGMNKEDLKAFLKHRNIEFVPQLGEAKLRELALKTYE